MACCSKHHKELDENGEGKCSVPMWLDGVPAGFCDKTAYGKPLPYESFRDELGKTRRKDGGYCGYVPFLACPTHGGPEHNQKGVGMLQKLIAKCKEGLNYECSA